MNGQLVIGIGLGWLLVCGGIPLCGHGDAVTLHDGKQITGKVIERNDEKIVIEVEGFPVPIPLRDVLRVALDEPSLADSPENVTTGELDHLLDVQTEAIPLTSELPFLPLLPVVIPPGRVFQVESVGLRIRRGPGQAYDAIDNLERGTMLEEIETDSGWLHGRLMDGTEGWVSLDHVEALAEVPVMVTADRLNMREGPGRYYKAVGRLYKGQLGKRFKQMEEDGGWSQIRMGRNRLGWVSTKYLIEVGNIEPLLPPLTLRTGDADSYVKCKKIGETLEFEVSADDLLQAGIAKIVALVRDKTLPVEPETAWRGEDILSVETLDSAKQLEAAGFSRDVIGTALGAVILRVKGYREVPIWRYTLTGPTRGVAYAFVTQTGPERGKVVVVK